MKYNNLVFGVFSLIVVKFGHAQKLDVENKVLQNCISFIKNDLKTANAIIADNCYTSASRFLDSTIISGFYRKVSVVMNKFSPCDSLGKKEAKCTCIVNPFANKTLKPNEKKHLLFVSPFFEDAMIIRVADSKDMIEFNGRYLMQVTNYIYLFKFNTKGRIIKSKRYHFETDS